jgi:calcium-binding protein CML
MSEAPRSPKINRPPSFKPSTKLAPALPVGVLLTPTAASPSSPPLQIPRRELDAVLRRLSHAEPSDDELDAVAALAAQPPQPGDANADLMEAFRVFDTDGHGCITTRVLEGILGGGPHACSVDADGELSSLAKSPRPQE